MAQLLCVKAATENRYNLPAPVVGDFYTATAEITAAKLVRRMGPLWICRNPNSKFYQLQELPDAWYYEGLFSTCPEEEEEMAKVQQPQIREYERASIS
jgi:hypothetical protein